MNIDIDFSELAALGEELAAGAATLNAQAGQAVSKSATSIKAAMRADMAASGHFGQAANSITFDRSGTEAEIGPTKGGAGAIANIAYFGGANGGGGTVRDPMEPALDELPGFEQALGDLADRILG